MRFKDAPNAADGRAPSPRTPDAESERSAVRIGAVIVTYFPEQAAVRRNVEALRPQVDQLVVVDNTPADRGGSTVASFCDPPEGWCDLIVMGRNAGLAAAQNVGIERLRRDHCDFVLLLDQDSLPTPGMVSALYDAWRTLTRAGKRVGAVGPRSVDPVTGAQSTFVRLGLGRMRSVLADGPGATAECDALIASGCLIPMSVLEDIGDMDAGLFIDHIDNEWGMRAQRRGYGLYGASNAELQHGIGERRLRIWLLRWRHIAVHSPIRDYYKVRNTAVVYFLRPASWRWRLYCAVTINMLNVVTWALLPQRFYRLRMMLRGLRDAALGNMGPIADSGRPGDRRDAQNGSGTAVRVFAGSRARQLARRLWRRFTVRRAGIWELVRAEVEGRSGIEIGGPSPIFSSDGPLPVYASANRIDNCNFSRDTLWEHSEGADAPFVFDRRRAPGRQLIAEATDLSQVPNDSCSFVLSSHALEHSANPLKALLEWHRVLRAGGVLVLVLPHKDATFDHRRPVTPLSHLQQDYDANTSEDDETHLPEILALHDMDRDEWAGSRQQFEERSRHNLHNRGLHHHVFDSRLAAQVVDWTGFRIEAMEARRPMDIIVLARKVAGERPDNATFLCFDAPHLAASPFATDRLGTAGLA